jgi:hypothetical protein
MQFKLLYIERYKGIHFFESTIDEEFSKMLDYIRNKSRFITK